MPKIEIYTQPGCSYCISAVTLLRQKGVTFEEISVPHGRPEREAVMRRSGCRTVPQVFMDGKFLGGCDDLMALEGEGKLDALLGRV